MTFQHTFAACGICLTVPVLCLKAEYRRKIQTPCIRGLPTIDRRHLFSGRAHLYHDFQQHHQRYCTRHWLDVLALGGQKPVLPMPAAVAVWRVQVPLVSGLTSALCMGRCSKRWPVWES